MILKRILPAFLILLTFISMGFSTCDPPVYSNWIINAGEYCTNSSITIITGNITVNGELTLTDSTLWINDDLTINGNVSFNNVVTRLNGSSDSASDVEILSGGKFEIDYSTITNGETSNAGYTFFYRDGSTGYMNNSNMSKAVGTGHNGLVIEADDIKIENNNIFDMEGYGITADSVLNVRIYNNAIYNVIDDCVDFANSDSIEVIGNTLHDCTNNIYLDNTNNSDISDNDMYNGGTTVLTLRNSHTNTFDNNNVSVGAWGGFWITSASTGNYFTNNYIFNNGDAGFYIDSASDSNTFTNNILDNNTNAGIYIDSCSNNIFLRNTLTNNDDGLEAVNTDFPLNYFANSTISTSANNDVDLSSDSNVYFVNVTSTSSNIADTSSLNVTWYMDVTVLKEEDYNALQGALVNIRDKNSALWYSGLSNAQGGIPQQLLSEYTETAGGKTYLANYNVSASYAGRDSNYNVTSFTSSQEVYVVLQIHISELTGTIISDCSNQGEEGVTISATGLGTNTTDSSGVYYLYGADGSYTLRFRKEGFKAGSEIVSLSGDTEKNLTIEKAYCALYGTGDIALGMVDTVTGVIVIIGALAVLIVIIYLWNWFKQK